jgi:crotonobetainyl-CoA:carnitine CoA-transferase CaiB-like acyl-CoA transferase
MHENQAKDKTFKPFEGLKVLDISSILAGPLAASFFAELGAEVIKVENLLSGGDATRQWKLAVENSADPFSAYYCSANYSKKVLLRDLTYQDDRLEVEKLLSECDIVVSNFQKKTAEKLGFLPAAIKEKYPGIIFAQLSAYEFDDPRPGYDLVMQGETGWISMTGTDSNHLAKIPVAIIDIIASHQIKEAILIALLKKMKSGIGSIIHVSLYKSAISALANQASNYLMCNHIPQPMGTLHPNIAPYGDLFSSLDGKKFMIAVGSDAQFKKLWFTLNLPDVKYHTFETNSKRLINRSALQLILQNKFVQFLFADLNEIFTTIGIPFCSIKSMKEVFAEDLAIDMVMTEYIDGVISKSVSSISFQIE